MMPWKGQKVMKMISLREESYIQMDGNTWLISVWHSTAVISEFTIPASFPSLKFSDNA